MDAPCWNADAGASGQLKGNRLPAHHVPLVVGRTWELGDSDLTIATDHVRLRTRAAERAAALEKRSDLFGGLGVALKMVGGVQERRHVNQVGNPTFSFCQIDTACRIAEPQRPLTQVVADVQQIVDLGEAPLRAAFPLNSMPFVSIDESTAPSVGCAIREGTEDHLLGRCLQLAANQRQTRIERVSVGEREIGLVRM